MNEKKSYILAQNIKHRISIACVQSLKRDVNFYDSTDFKSFFKFLGTGLRETREFLDSDFEERDLDAIAEGFRDVKRCIIPSIEYEISLSVSNAMEKIALNAKLISRLKVRVKNKNLFNELSEIQSSFEEYLDDTSPVEISEISVPDLDLKLLKDKVRLIYDLQICSFLTKKYFPNNDIKPLSDLIATILNENKDSVYPLVNRLIQESIYDAKYPVQSPKVKKIIDALNLPESI